MSRAIDLRDLIHRPTRTPDIAPVRELIHGKSVLVTGAGGSIGTELTRQIAMLNPAKLAIIDNCELNLYTSIGQFESVSAYFSDVRELGSLFRIVQINKPDVVFHTAALKHVPIVEGNPLEGIKTNVLGTRNVVDACVTNGVKKMVMVSTDKAVNPVSVMGATKRVAEMYCRAAGYSAVRFGNVIGSSGSVVPLFEKQIKRGGPVTVTHPDAERYFMSIDEAVELVLQAATCAPATYVLDMGHPVNILDLANDMIRLSGHMPGDEIEITIGNLRNGERLQEELFYGREDVKPSGIDGIVVAESAIFHNVGAAIDRIEELTEAGHEADAIKTLWRAVRVGT